MATLIIAVAIAWIANYARRHKAAFAAIRDAGGTIQFANVPKSAFAAKLEGLFGPELFGKAYKIDLRKTMANNDILKHVAVFRELRALDLSYAKVDDAGLEMIADLPLTELWLQSTNVTDRSASILSGMKHIEFLALNATGLTDKFLEDLAALPNLQNLSLRGTKIVGSGLECLSRHPRLEKLDVYSTNVGDVGVAGLVGSKSLTELGLSMTKISNQVFVYLDKLPSLSRADLSANDLVSTEMVLEFERSHPKCDIEWYGK